MRSWKLQKKLADQERYVQETLMPWWARVGGGFINNPDAGPMPDMKSSPLDQARALGHAAVKVVREVRHKALVEILKNTGTKDE